jgi:hypothetical protein
MVLGMYSKELLGDQRFQTLIQLFGQQMAADMLNTAPHEAKKREGLHAAYMGFAEFTDLMSKFAQAFETLAKANELDNQPLRVTDTDAYRQRRHF